MENKNTYYVYFVPDGTGYSRYAGSLIYRGNVGHLDYIRDNYESLINFAKESAGEEITEEELSESVDNLQSVLSNDSETEIINIPISNGKIYMFSKICKKKK